jgi:hypothetical protein
VLAAPAVSRARDGVRSAHEHTGTVGAFRHSLRNGLTAYAALSLETNSSCLHRRRIDGARAPGRASQRLRRLDASHGRQDHTVLPYANITSRLPRRRSLTGQSPPCDPYQRSGRCRVHRIPSPTSVTIAIRPSWRAGTGGFVGLIWGREEEVYFCCGDWTGQITLKWFGNFSLWSNVQTSVE